MSILRILRYNGSLVTWTVVSLTTDKFTLKSEFLIYQNSVRTAQETHYVSVTKKNNLLMPLKEQIAAYCENCTKQTNIFCGQSE
jgi:hypothetical protein